jgi:cellulose biosynthesis protein BcsQ
MLGGPEGIARRATASEMARALDVVERPRGGCIRIGAVSGGPGGVGKSTTTLNIAKHYAMKGNRVCVVDFDIVNGSLRTFVGGLTEEGRPAPGIYELFRTPHWDDEDIRQHVYSRFGIDFLLGPYGVRDHVDQVINAENARDLVRRLSTHYDRILMDFHAGEYLAPHVLPQADVILVLLAASSNSVQAVRNELVKLNRLNVADKVRILVNRGRIAEDVLQSLNAPVIAELPEDETVRRLGEAQRFVVEDGRTSFAKILREAADRIVEEQAAVEDQVMNQIRAAAPAA